MADKKITDLPAAAGAALAQLLEIVNDPGGTPVSQKLTLTQIKTLLDTLYALLTGATFTGQVNVGGATQHQLRTNGTVSISNGNLLIDALGTLTWSNGNILSSSIFYADAGTQESVDFSNRFLMYNTLLASVDWNLQICYAITGGAATESVKWGSRLLANTTVDVLDWSGTASAAPGSIQAIVALKDLEFSTSALGPILMDRTSAGDFYRLFVDNGILSVELVTS